jgi:hypothetical protein
MAWLAAYLAFTLLLAGLAWYPCGCSTFTCLECTGDVPAAISVVVAAPANTVNCSACAGYAGTYVVPFTSACLYRTTFANTPGCMGGSTISVQVTIGDSYNAVEMDINMTGYDLRIAYWVDSTGAGDCAFVDHEVPWSADSICTYAGQPITSAFITAV